MSPQEPEDPELPEYPGHTAAFGRIMRTAHDGQTTVRSMTPFVVDLMKVRDEELVLLHQVRVMSKIMVWQETIAAEIARRNMAATVQSVEAIRELQRSIETLHLTTQAASVTSREAIGDLNTSIGQLRDSTDSWSRWLTRLTIAVMVFTAALVVVAIVQATR